jgi:hypothetical protein
LQNSEDNLDQSLDQTQPMSRNQSEEHSKLQDNDALRTSPVSIELDTIETNTDDSRLLSTFPLPPSEPFTTLSIDTVPVVDDSDTKDTPEMSAHTLALWASCQLLLMPFTAYTRINVPIIIQAHGFSFFLSLLILQSIYYSR